MLISRDPSGLADLAPGVPAENLRRGDFTDPTTLPSAFAGVDELLIISTDAVGSRLEPQRAAVAAARDAGVRRVVYTSVPGPEDDNPAGVVADHAATEAAIRESGLAWTFLRNNLYADMQRPSLDQAAASGSFVTNIGDGRTAYVSRADCAAVAAAVLATDGHDGQAYDVTGPEAVGADDLAALAGRISGSDVAVVQVDDAAYVAGLEQAGLPTPVAQLLASFGTSTREGWLEDVTSVVEDLTGRAPQTLAEAVGL
ncbi:MAG: NAD(P)H-binding protein [Aeromicrobium erythreum]